MHWDMDEVASFNRQRLTDFFASGVVYVARGGSSREHSTILNESGERIGFIQESRGIAIEFARLFIKSTSLPLLVNICNADGETLASLRRGWGLSNPRLEIIDARQNIVGFVRQKDRSQRPRVKVFNPDGKKIAEITAGNGASELFIIDRDYHAFGQIIPNPPLPNNREKGKATIQITLNKRANPGDDFELTMIAALAVQTILTGGSKWPTG